MIRGILTGIGESIRTAFTGWRLLLQLAIIPITYILVVLNFDWNWYLAMRPFAEYLFPAALLGFFVPVFLPIALYLYGAVRSERLRRIAYAITQAELLGMFTSFVYKAFTGRAHPDLMGTLVNISHEFDFGFMRHGVFWGWPSSHTTVAFAFASCLWMLFPRSALVRYTAVAYALYIGIGVSGTIHWFSDFAAGACVGIAIGSAVGSTFLKRLSAQ